MKLLAIKSDVLGSLATGLCAIHCLATPLIFVAQTCTQGSGCGGPAWWSSIDYFFIMITLFAVVQSAKNTSKQWMKYGLYSSWVILSLIVLNEKLAIFPLSVYWKYLAAVTMIAMHMYNLKFCQCEEEGCCATAITS